VKMARRTRIDPDRFGQALVVLLRPYIDRKNLRKPAVTETGVALAQCERTGTYDAGQLFGPAKSQQIALQITNPSDLAIQYTIDERQCLCRIFRFPLVNHGPCFVAGFFPVRCPPLRPCEGVPHRNVAPMPSEHDIHGQNNRNPGDASGSM
jgi:hypothetical protein